MFRRAMQINNHSSKEIERNNCFLKELHTLCLKSWDGSWGLQFCFFPEPRETKNNQKNNYPSKGPQTVCVCEV